MEECDLDVVVYDYSCDFIYRALLIYEYQPQKHAYTFSTLTSLGHTRNGLTQLWFYPTGVWPIRPLLYTPALLCAYGVLIRSFVFLRILLLALFHIDKRSASVFRFAIVWWWASTSYKSCSWRRWSQFSQISQFPETRASKTLCLIWSTVLS